jgi:PIN like domain
LPSASPPEFFIDRSLGRHVVPDALREAGAVAHVMADVYGERIGQGLSDEEWLHDTGERGWVVLMKDAKGRLQARRDLLDGGADPGTHGR